MLCARLQHSKHGAPRAHPGLALPPQGELQAALLRLRLRPLLRARVLPRCFVHCPQPHAATHGRCDQGCGRSFLPSPTYPAMPRRLQSASAPHGCSYGDPPRMSPLPAHGAILEHLRAGRLGADRPTHVTHATLMTPHRRRVGPVLTEPRATLRPLLAELPRQVREARAELLCFRARLPQLPPQLRVLGACCCGLRARPPMGQKVSFQHAVVLWPPL